MVSENECEDPEELDGMYIQGSRHQGKSRKFFSFWKVREFQYFLSRVRENDLAEVTKSLSLISRHIFLKNPMVAGTKFSLALLGISHDTLQICILRPGKVRGKCTEMSGNLKQADCWEA